MDSGNGFIIYQVARNVITEPQKMERGEGSRARDFLQPAHITELIPQPPHFRPKYGDRHPCEMSVSTYKTTQLSKSRRPQSEQSPT